MSEIPFFKGRKSLVFLAGREFLVLSRYMLRILIGKDNLEEASSGKAGIMTGRTISLLGGPDFGQNEYISLLFRSFSLERPKQNKLVPQWNLGLVLAAINSPSFEPAEEVDLRFLYYKCCFLLAYSFCPKSGPPSKEIVLPIADLYPLIVEGTNCLISNR
jgi:hypothetical protein